MGLDHGALIVHQTGVIHRPYRRVSDRYLCAVGIENGGNAVFHASIVKCEDRAHRVTGDIRGIEHVAHSG